MYVLSYGCIWISLVNSIVLPLRHITMGGSPKGRGLRLTPNPIPRALPSPKSVQDYESHMPSLIVTGLPSRRVAMEGGSPKGEGLGNS